MLLKLPEGTKLCDYLIPVIPGKEEIGIEEYSFSQSTLEQVLSSFHVFFFFHELVLGSQISGHLRDDYLIKYAYFSKCYLERFASISAPEK